MKLFKSLEGERQYMAAYERSLSLWTVPYDTQEIETSWGRTHVIVTGPLDAPPLLLLHGMGSSATIWGVNIEALSQQYRVYAPDTMGDFGRSVPTKRPRTPPQYIAWLTELLDGLGLATTYIMGISFGGWLTAQLVHALPHRIKKAILLSPAATFRAVRFPFLLGGFPLMVYPTRAYANWYMRWAAINPQNDEHYERYFGALIEQFYLGWKHSALWPLSIPNVFNNRKLAEIQTPLLLMIGEDDKITNPHKAIARAQQHLPNGQTILLPNASHDLTFAQRERIEREACSFFQETH